VFHSGDTGATYLTSDVIMDFNRISDWIDGDVTGTASNFGARDTTSFQGFDGCLAYANISFGGHYV
jgi:hypothetical protein